MAIFYKRFLRLIAILPFKGRDYTYLVTRILFVYYFVSSIITLSMFLVYALSMNGMPPIDSIYETVIVIGLNLRYYLLLGRRFEFANLFDESQRIWELCDEEGRRMVVRHFERKIRLLFQCILGSGVFTSILFSLSAVNMSLKAALNNNDSHTKHYMPYKWFVEDGADLWPGYKFNLPVQMLVATNGSMIGATVDTAAPFLIMVGAGYFRVLQRRLYRVYINAINDRQPLRADRELVACCRLHQRILRYCSKIDKITRTMFFVQLMCTVYVTSLIGIKIVGTDPDRYKHLPAGLFNLSQLFICQWAPDHLINESTAISTAVYHISFPWMKRRIGKLLVLIIARSQRPVQMTAAGFVTLSLENFGSMLKAALSFFTMLRNFNV